MKKLSLLLFTFFAITLFSFSCKNNYCDNEASLFVMKTNTLEIPFDSLQSVLQCLTYLERTYCKEGEQAQPFLYFDIKKGEIVESSGRNVLALGIEPTPCTSAGELEYDFDKILEIVLDGNNILIEDHRMPLDSIGQYVYYQYLSYGKRQGFSGFPKGNGIWLITEMKRPLTDFNPIINEIVKGYLEMADFYSETFLGKDVCNLDMEEMGQLKNILQFHLAFKYSDDVLPKVEVSF